MAKITKLKVPVTVTRDPANPGLVQVTLDEEAAVEVGNEEFEFTNPNVLNKVTEVANFNNDEISKVKSTLFPNEATRETFIYQKLVTE